MNKNTYDTIYSLINYYEDDYLLPLNRAELEAYKENTPASLNEAFKHWDLAVNAFENLSKRVEMLCKSENAYLTADQIWELSNWIEDIESDVRYVGSGLIELAQRLGAITEE
ncbi:hypothetical protein ACH32V_17935 [Escherichia coli]|uniref:hypothetical protein n=1 Tax=Escherichia coli TaxID=562 RepID=UPI000E1D3FFC|nr:hypothetical protein [Escherichia coli]RDS53845.1 hypothetical protein C3986_04529 [Escherichia coli]